MNMNGIGRMGSIVLVNILDQFEQDWVAVGVGSVGGGVGSVGGFRGVKSPRFLSSAVQFLRFVQIC